MEYFLSHHTDSSTERIELTQKQYEEIKSSKQVIFEIISIEEKYDMLLENVKELEQNIFNLCLNNLFGISSCWSNFRSNFKQINRRVLNLFATTRLYLDHLDKHSKEVSPEITISIQEQRRHEFETNIYYRFMEKLRNYTQHKDLPISFFSFESSWIEDEKGKALRYCAIPKLDLAELKKDSCFSTRIIEEMLPLGDKLDIRPIILSYIESIWNIHSKWRSILDPIFNQCKSVYLGNQDLFTRIRNDNTSYILLIARDQGNIIAKDDIFESPLLYLQEMRRKNTSLKNLPRRFVDMRL